jgi:predicted nucleic acid-binding protein
MAVVVDASVILNWYFEDEDDAGTRILRHVAGRTVLVPAHWEAEVANGILVAERRGRTSAAQIGHLFSLLDALDLEVDCDGALAVFDRVLPLARAHRLTIYDALYLELAERRGLPLATLDAALAQAAASVGLATIGAESG